MSDIFEQIEMPNFSPIYDSDTKYGYTNRTYKNNLKQLLNEASNDFCMYCYVRVTAEGKYLGQIEHSIEKTNSRYLIECVPNMAWVCSCCNDVFKKQDEKQRKLLKKDIAIFERGIVCKSNDCKKECVKYKNLKKKYLQQDNAHIILQPNGIKGEDTGLDLRIQYNVQSAQFEPSTYQGNYSKAEKDFIVDHINRFHLNDEKYRSNALMTFLEDVIESNGYIGHMPELNMVVTEFKKKLQGIEREQVLKICEKLYTYYVVKLKEG